MITGRRSYRWVYVESVVDDTDIEASGLLDGLDGMARAERAELIEWLLAAGFTVDHIRAAIAPMLLPAGRVLGDVSEHVSARQVCDETGIDPEIFGAIQRALGLPRVDDPDAPLLRRADASTLTGVLAFLDKGFTRDQLIAVSRVLGHGLAQAAEAMRQAVLESVIQPGATELQIAMAYGEKVREVAPMLGPMVQDVLLLQLRHTLETEAINVAERAAGSVPGAREVTVCFADLVGFTRLGETVPPEELESPANRLASLARDVAPHPCTSSRRSGMRSCSSAPTPRHS